MSISSLFVPNSYNLNCFDLDVQDNLNVANNLTANELSVTGTVNLPETVNVQDLICANETCSGTLSTNNLSISGTFTPPNTLNVTTLNCVNEACTGTATILNLNCTSNAVTNTLSSTGLATLATAVISNNLTVDNHFTCNGNSLFNGNTNHQSPVTFNGTLTTTSSASFNDGATINNGAVVSGGLTADSLICSANIYSYSYYPTTFIASAVYDFIAGSSVSLFSGTMASRQNLYVLSVTVNIEASSSDFNGGTLSFGNNSPTYDNYASVDLSSTEIAGVYTNISIPLSFTTPLTYTNGANLFVTTSVASTGTTATGSVSLLCAIY